MDCLHDSCLQQMNAVRRMWSLYRVEKKYEYKMFTHNRDQKLAMAQLFYTISFFYFYLYLSAHTQPFESPECCLARIKEKRKLEHFMYGSVVSFSPEILCLIA